MRKLIEEIRQQPHHIREIFMWVMVVITFSVVGFVWFDSTRTRFLALVNPEEYQDTRAFAAAPDSDSPFAAIGRSFRNLKANIADLFDGKNDSSAPASPGMTPKPTQL